MDYIKVTDPSDKPHYVMVDKIVQVYPKRVTKREGSRESCTYTEICATCICLLGQGEIVVKDDIEKVMHNIQFCKIGIREVKDEC